MFSLFVVVQKVSIYVQLHYFLMEFLLCIIAPNYDYLNFFSYFIPLYDQLLFYRWVRLVEGITPAGGGTSRLSRRARGRGRSGRRAQGRAWEGEREEERR